MQLLSLTLAPLLLLLLATAVNAATKIHTVALGAARRVPYILPDAPASNEPPAMLKVRPLLVDGRQKEWTVGDAHDVTDRSFTIRRVMRLNDALPTETGDHWNWQPGPWLLVDRATGHVTALHLPDFDAAVSEALWYRDYAAYCGLSATGKTLNAVVAQIGARRPVVQKELSKWATGAHPGPACAPAQWQRQPMRVTFQAVGGAVVGFEVVGGASALIEEGDNSDDQ